MSKKEDCLNNFSEVLISKGQGTKPTWMYQAEQDLIIQNVIPESKTPDSYATVEYPSIGSFRFKLPQNGNVRVKEGACIRANEGCVLITGVFI